MRKSRIRQGLFAVAIFVLALATTARSQTPEKQLLRDVENAYKQLNYSEAEKKARAALEDYQRFDADELTELHKILGIIYYSENRVAEAKTHFQSALDLTPDLALDSLLVSPKILRFFNSIKAEWQALGEHLGSDVATVRYVRAQDPRAGAALRSMLLPGWGQVYKGEPGKGHLLMAAWGVGVIGSIAAHVARNNAHDAYRSETDPDQIESRYQTYNTYQKLHNGFLIFSAGVWLYAYFDALLKTAPPPKPALSKTGTAIFPTISHDVIGVVVSKSF